MPVFKCFFKVVRMNKWGLLTYIVIFSVMAILISEFVSPDSSLNFSQSSVPITVIDRDGSDMSRALTDYLDERHDLTELEDDTETLQDALFYRSVEYILFISDGFEADFTGGKGGALLENVKLPSSTTGVYIDNQIDRFLSTTTAYLSAEYELADALESAADDLRESTTVEMSANNEEGISRSGYYFQFLPYTLISIVIMSLGPVLIAFNQNDLSKRIESSSLKLRERNVQIALGCIITSVLLWAVLIAIAFIRYGGEMLSEISALRVLNSLVFLAVCVSIGFLVGQFLKSTTALSAINNAIALGMSFLCGIFVSQELLGAGVLAIGKFLPAYWYIRSNDMLSGSILDMELYCQGILIQLGFAAAIFAVAIVVSRQKKFSRTA